MRMAYQIENTDPDAVLNEIYMAWHLSRNQATGDTEESLISNHPLTMVVRMGRIFSDGGQMIFPESEAVELKLIVAEYLKKKMYFTIWN